MKLCDPTKVSVASLLGLFATYLVGLGAMEALEPTRAALIASQGLNVAALAALVTSVSLANRNKCTSGWTSAWIVLGVLGLNLVARLASVAVLRGKGRHAENDAAKFVRWDTAAKVVGIVAVLAEMYYTIVPRMGFRTTLFVLGIVFVLPLVFVVPRLIAGAKADRFTLLACLAACQDSYVSFKNNDLASRVVVKTVGDTTIVAFAGTETKEDWKADLNVADTTLPWLRPGDVARAHKGFATMYSALRQHLHSLVPKRAHAVVFTGHSLGGALATLAALDFASNGTATVSAYTFGAPHVGDRNFKNVFDARVPVAVRCVNPFDPVPKALSAQLVHTKGYYPVASLTNDSVLTAHDLSTYKTALSKPRWVQVVGMVAPAGYVALAGAGVATFHMLRRQR